MQRPWGIAAVAAAALLLGIHAARADDERFTMPNNGISLISDPNEAMREVRGRIEAHDLPDAVRDLQRYVLVHPEEGALRQFLGDLYFSTGDFYDAEQTYRAMLDDFPLDHDTRYRLGMLYMAENHLDRALTQFNDSLPDVSSIYYLVLIHQRNGDLPVFRRQIERTAQLHPNDANAQIELAQLYGALYLPRDAAAAFERALIANPNSQEGLDGLGRSQTAIGAYSDAEQSLGKCLSLDPTDYGCLDALGAVYTQQRRYDEAQAELEHAYRIAPESPQALVSLGRLYDARGQWQQAIAYYQQALYVWPYLSDAYVDIAFDQEEHGDNDAAKATVLKGLSYGDDARLHYMLGYLYRASGERALALIQFTAAEQSLDPDVARFAKESAAALQSASP